MTNTTTTDAPAPNAPQPAPPPDRPSVWSRLWSGGQFVVALGLTLAALAYLLMHPGSKPEVATDDRQAAADEAVKLAGPGLIRVAPDTPLGKKLSEGASAVRPTRITAPVLTVTGTVVASLRPGAVNGTAVTPPILSVTGGAAAGRASDYWQFNAPEVLTTYTDWQKAKADIAFTRTQLAATRELAAAKIDAQQKVVARMVRTVAAGTDPESALATEQANLQQVKITSKADVHKAETDLLNAQKAEAALARQLQQAGLDPALLTSVTSDVDIVMADVPETVASRVKVGHRCEARFFGIPDQLFGGQVKSIAPVVSKERRSLRVLFTITDLSDQLRPGMFADIGLGTDPREALLAPADGVVHVGRSDYVLVAAGEPGAWRVTEVDVGEVRGDRVEILKGLASGDTVAGAGAVLLKPQVVKSVKPVETPGNGNGGGK